MIPDPELRWASCGAYNDWLAETFAAQSSRFAGAAMIAVQEIEPAVAEIERVAGLKLRSIMLPMSAPDGQPYNSPVYDPIWAAAQAHGMPVSFHVGTGSNPVTERGPGGGVINYVEVGLGAQRTLGYLAASGVLARFPAQHVVMVECGAGWLAWLLERRTKRSRSMRRGCSRSFPSRRRSTCVAKATSRSVTKVPASSTVASPV